MTKEKKEKQAEKQKKDPVLKDFPEESRVRSPLIWVLFLAVPLFLGLLVSLMREQGAEDARQIPPEAIKAAAQPAVSEDASIAKSPVAAVDRRDFLRRRMAAPRKDAYPCDFAPWVGLKVTEDMLEAIRQAGREYRILPPGSPGTMDYSAARINFDVDEKGTVIRVWCG